ncbi:MAG: LysE family translocator [Hyphomicrobiales bacterium]|nr:LysE family translocator [Hyphomicrobiales bacterium]MCP4997316.1 LysE family translocator [Hyphomicrobiales bacterium]
MYFIPEMQVLAAFAVAGVVLAATPGPDMTLFIGRALSKGRLAAFAVLTGTMTGIVVHTVLVAFGVSALVVASPTAFAILKTGGAAYLLWLAVQAICKGSTFRLGAVAERRQSLLANWSHGLAVNLLNPKIIIFFMTFLPQFVSADDPDIRDKLLFLGLFFNLISLPVIVPMVLAADRLAIWLKSNKRIMRAIDYCFAGVFSVFAMRILLTEGK